MARLIAVANSTSEPGSGTGADGSRITSKRMLSMPMFQSVPHSM
ncbi:MAG: hypothetical protein V5B39_20730 [Accumulibacter sp.]|jgi:hypothetical protein